MGNTTATPASTPFLHPFPSSLSPSVADFGEVAGTIYGNSFEEDLVRFCRTRARRMNQHPRSFGATRRWVHQQKLILGATEQQVELIARVLYLEGWLEGKPSKILANCCPVYIAIVYYMERLFRGSIFPTSRFFGIFNILRTFNQALQLTEDQLRTAARKIYSLPNFPLGVILSALRDISPPSSFSLAAPNSQGLPEANQ